MAMEQIKLQEPDAFAIIKDAGVDERTLLTFEREGLQDLFSGSQHFLLRRRLWKILENVKGAEVLESTPEPKLRISEWNVEEPVVQLPSPVSSSSRPAPSIKNEGESCVVTTEKPVFVLYTDSEITCMSQQGELSTELMNRLVRSTISNMRTATNNLPTPREPTNDEILDMAKALSKRFPCTRKVYQQDKKEFESVVDEDILTVEQRNELHVFLYKKLKKRISNITPARKPQGKVPARSAKRIKLGLPERVKTELSEDIEEEEENPNVAITDRHYLSLNKEQRKLRPNKEVINKYLDLEFPSRKKVLQETPKEERPNKIFKEYPCFKDPCEVVEEVRRTLSQQSTGNIENVMEGWVERFQKVLDNLIYFGISKGVMRPPTSASQDGKAVHLFKGFNQIFKPKGKISSKQLKAEEVLHIIENDTKSGDWQQKRSLFIPGLMVSRSGAAVLLGQTVLNIFQANEMMEAIISFLGCFYLLDYDYPQGWQVSLSVLQNLIFGDKIVHPDVQGDVAKCLDEFERFCSGL